MAWSPTPSSLAATTTTTVVPGGFGRQVVCVVTLPGGRDPLFLAVRTASSNGFDALAHPVPPSETFEDAAHNAALTHLGTTVELRGILRIETSLPTDPEPNVTVVFVLDCPGSFNPKTKRSQKRDETFFCLLVCPSRRPSLSARWVASRFFPFFTSSLCYLRAVSGTRQELFAARYFCSHSSTVGRSRWLGGAGARG